MEYIAVFRTRAWALVAAVIMAIVLAFTIASPAEAAHPAPTNGRIVFTSDRDGDKEIYTMGLDGSSVEQVTTNTYTDRYPSWGPGGEDIAFVSDRDGNDEIYLVDKNGVTTTRLTNNSAPDLHPTWSNNGMEVAFQRTPTGADTEIYSLNSNAPEGSTDEIGATVAARQLTDNAYNDEHPNYGPNGELAFDREISSQNRIVVMGDTDTMAETVITPAGTDSEWDPNWAPNGSALAYTKGDGTSSGIWKMNPDGSNRSVIIDNSGVQDQRPAYYPEFNNLSYSRGSDGSREIYRYKLDGTNHVNLSNNSADDFASEVRPINETRSIETVVETSLTDGDTTHSATISFDERESYMNATSYQCRIDSGSWSTCTSPVTYTGLSLGADHTFEVKGTSNGVTEAPVATTWQVISESAPESLGLIVPEVFYSLELENLFGDVFSNQYAGMGDEAHIGSPAYEAGFVGCCNRVSSFLQSGYTTDSDIKACKNKYGYFKAGGAAKYQRTGTWHYATRDGWGLGCNTTFTSLNHIKHVARNYNESNWGLPSWHYG